MARTKGGIVQHSPFSRRLLARRSAQKEGAPRITDTLRTVTSFPPKQPSKGGPRAEATLLRRKIPRKVATATVVGIAPSVPPGNLAELLSVDNLPERLQEILNQMGTQTK